MNKIIGFIFLVALAGCSRDVTSYELKKAEAFCKDHYGVYSLEVVVSSIGSIRAFCNDGVTALVK